MPDQGRFHGKTGFTLVELLVVIAVIGILAGILLPIFTSVRRASYKSVCQSNLKQLYAAFMLYADDWHDTLPCPGGQYGDLSYWAQENGGIEVYLRVQHLGLKSVYCCPSYTGVWKSQWSPRTYGMNSFLREPADIPYPASLAILRGISLIAIAAPSETILLYEGIPAGHTHYLGEGYVYRCGNWEWVRGYRPEPIYHWQDVHKSWHGHMNNYLMCDGHVMTMEPEKYPFEITRANNLWFARKYR